MSFFAKNIMNLINCDKNVKMFVSWWNIFLLLFPTWFFMIFVGWLVSWSCTRGTWTLRPAAASQRASYSSPNIPYHSKFHHAEFASCWSCITLRLHHAEVASAEVPSCLSCIMLKLHHAKVASCCSCIMMKLHHAEVASCLSCIMLMLHHAKVASAEVPAC